MKKLLKRLGVFVVLLSLLVGAFPTVTYAGGHAAAICVRYVIIDKFGSYTFFHNTSYDWNTDLLDGVLDGDGLTQTVTGPEGTGNTKMDDPDVYRYYIKPTAGTYTLTDIVYPDGYELDDVATAGYPLSVTVTEQDITDYNKWVSDDTEAGTWEFKIYVPIKKVGTTTALYKKPNKEKIKVENNKYSNGTVTALRLEGGNWFGIKSLGKMTFEVWYSTSKSGSYKKLKSGLETNYLSMSGLSKIKNGKTYYFKARAIKTVGKKTIKGPWSAVKKVKVKK